MRSTAQQRYTWDGGLVKQKSYRSLNTNPINGVVMPLPSWAIMKMDLSYKTPGARNGGILVLPF